MNLVNGLESDAISVNDRGLTYGDGVFRTLVLRDGIAVLWQRQYAKLASDCAALRIVCPTMAVFERDIALIAAKFPNCVLKITVTRGIGARGYAMPAAALPQRIVCATPMPVYPAHFYESGVRTRFCRTRLSEQPLLAGIKHLNRLENVLARSEWNDASAAEGLMLDNRGNVVCGTMTNLFAVRCGELHTPDLTRCGVAGVTRDLILEMAKERGVPTCALDTDPAGLTGADELFLVNSVIGIWPVAALEGHSWARGAMTEQIMNWLQDATRH